MGHIKKFFFLGLKKKFFFNSFFDVEKFYSLTKNFFFQPKIFVFWQKKIFFSEKKQKKIFLDQKFNLPKKLRYKKNSEWKKQNFFFLNQSSIYRRNPPIKKNLNGKNKPKWLRDLSEKKIFNKHLYMNREILILKNIIGFWMGIFEVIDPIIKWLTEHT